MGFYAPAQIVRDAQDHGVEVRPVCVNASEWDCTLEPVDSRFAVRLGLRMVKGLAEAHATQIARAAPFISVEDLWRRARVPMAALTRIPRRTGSTPSACHGARPAGSSRACPTPTCRSSPRSRATSPPPPCAR
ncbi:helix-hairpin-helix domain-containing protein [Paracoccus mutanolyticus]|uniref:helix-hairpin-helix domain-containing protein n=1 Tax=Paracoccus mutanolyticus TaxID=1499308 RepID=UPI001CB9D7BA|nr:hypothetical protein [Paracoccus mutanolyticus]